MKNNVSVRFLLSVISVYCLIAGNSCNNEEILPPQNPVMVKLTLDDVGVTETWIKVSSGDANGTFALKRDSVTIASNLHAPLDTIIHDEGLLPNHSYQYVASTEPPITVTTMDTTSHNFTWELTILGDGNASSLNDIAIINDTLAYAVGEIYKKDSTGHYETTPYNVAKWNGVKWQLMRIKFRLDYGTSVVYTYTNISAVYAFTENDIWFVHYAGGVTRYKDGNWVMMEFPISSGPGDVNKIWGKNSSELYFVSDLGRITYYNGSSWSRIESGTRLNIYDIWGAYNPKNLSYEILAVACDPGKSYDRKILQITGLTASAVSDYPIPSELASIWFIPDRHYYVVGDGNYEKLKLKGANWKSDKLQITQYFTTGIYGTNLNDVFIVGSYGECLHYNGVTWKSFMNTSTAINGAYSNIRIKGNLVIAVGYVNSKGCVLVGKRG